VPALILEHHGQSEKEASVKNVEAQASEAPQSEPPQEAYVAEIIRPSTDEARPIEPAAFRGGFFVSRKWSR
jgi:hypothetical protein